MWFRRKKQPVSFSDANHLAIPFRPPAPRPWVQVSEYDRKAMALPPTNLSDEETVQWLNIHRPYVCDCSHFDIAHDDEGCMNCHCQAFHHTEPEE